MTLLRRPFILIAALITASLLSACASSSYMGISLKPGAADPALQQLAQRARSGDKQAQLELGIAFEEGRGVERESKKGSILVRRANTSTYRGSSQWIYLPSPTPGASGRVAIIEQAPVIASSNQTNRNVNNEIHNEISKPRIILQSDGEKQISCGSTTNFIDWSLSNLIFCTQNEGIWNDALLHESGFFQQVLANIVVEKRSCPSPTLVSRGIICSSEYHEIEIFIKEFKIDRCYRYGDMNAYLQKFGVDTASVISSSVAMLPAQQASVTVGKSVMLMYPAPETLETCITRILIVKSI